MNDYIEILNEWLLEGPVAIARVTKTWGSSPRPVGAVMLVNAEGKMAGSVSGGCVEGAVVKKSMEVLDGENSVRLNYGVSDEEAWSVGLSCGGSIQVFVEKIGEDEVWKTLMQSLKDNKSAVLVSSLEDGGNTRSLVQVEESNNVVGEALSDELLHSALEAYSKRTNLSVTISKQEYFIQVFPRKPLLLVIGAAHITVDLVALGNQFGFETVVIDPRGYFAKNVTFTSRPAQIIEAYPSEVLHDYPLDAYTFAAILSHDPKIDDDALQVILPKNIGYVGALGSKKTHAKRTNRLLEKGVAKEQIDTIYAPIGEAINARTAKEIALSIMSQIVKVQNQFMMRK